MKKSAILVSLVLAPLVIGRALYVIQLPTHDFSMRLGQKMTGNVTVFNDPNEQLPYEVGVSASPHPNFSFTDDYDPGALLHKIQFTFEPNEAQVGQNVIRFKATEPMDTVDPLAVSKAIRITVHPAKLPQKIEVSGCRIF